jgi:uncharacterized protein (DUF305 family)
MNKFFLHQIKQTKGTIEKGIVVKDTYEGAKQGFHAYLGAYAYGQSPDTDFVSCHITDMSGAVLMTETWWKQTEEPEA